MKNGVSYLLCELYIFSFKINKLTEKKKNGISWQWDDKECFQYQME